MLAEPDFRVLNLLSTLRLPVRGSNFQLTHRFKGNLRQGSFNENASNLFGLDQGAVVGFEYRFGVARHSQAIVYRTGLDDRLWPFSVGCRRSRPRGRRKALHRHTTEWSLQVFQ